jgi:exodeoxyribonuclease VII large subunit
MLNFTAMPKIKTIALDNSQPERKIFTVTELNNATKRLLEREFRTIWLEAEISNFACPSSGHWYFSLKDDSSQVRCAMFRGANQRVQHQIADGVQVLVKAKVSLYPTRGDYQLIVDYMELAGTGKLHQEFERLKAKLASEGLFDEQHKQPIADHYPRIGVITSATGAAIKDVLSVIKRRFPLTEVIIYPCMVQGAQAANDILKQLQVANQRSEVDCLLLVRGGGSLEDLWCFNDEALAREIFNSKLPIVSGVGHEVDFTICDFVADLRAPTPTAAAESVTQDQRTLMDYLVKVEAWLIDVTHGQIQDYAQQLDYLEKRLQSPAQLLATKSQQLEMLKQRIKSLTLDAIYSKQQRLHEAKLTLSQSEPKALLSDARHQQEQLLARLKVAINSQLKDKQQQFATKSAHLDALSPLKTIDRGYSVLKDDKQQLVTSINQVKLGESIEARVTDGKISATVTQCEPLDPQ